MPCRCASRKSIFLLLGNLTRYVVKLNSSDKDGGYDGFDGPAQPADTWTQSGAVGRRVSLREGNSQPQTIERYGRGTPNDWVERNIYSKFRILGVTLMGVADVICSAQILWIPFWAASVINGVGHYWGYRNWSTPDASTNIVPWGIIIGSEELHNNHHAYTCNFSSDISL